MIATQQPAIKVAASVADVARLVGLSRARYYSLVRGGVFPWPAYDIRSRRPIYTEEQQRLCLEVRRRNCGINGQPVLFYARRIGGPSPTPARTRPRPKVITAATSQHAEAVLYLRGLGLPWVTPSDVEAALGDEYPKGTVGVDQGTVLGRLFVHLHTQGSRGSRLNPADNV